MIEFAMVVPVLVLLFLFIIAGGQVMYVKHMVQQSAYEATRKAIATSHVVNNQTKSLSTISEEVRTSAKNFLTQMPLIVVSDSNPQISSLFLKNNCWVKGNELTITVEYKIKPIFPIFSVDANGDMKIVGKMTQTVENGTTDMKSVYSSSGAVCG